jgi:protein-S-isoprenylcysteine O-methyltransferase Ste14
MSRGLAALGSALFFLIAPTTVAGVVPWWISRWHLQAPFFDLQLVRWFGVVLILLGVPVLVETFARFALQGRGTPAPIAPTQHLVITGPNRYVRNPIYLALVAIVFGQALILGHTGLLVYDALLWIGFHIFVLAYEEPTLRRTFGAEYDAYCADVSRWLPRLPGSTSVSEPRP